MAKHILRLTAFLLIAFSTSFAQTPDGARTNGATAAVIAAAPAINANSTPMELAQAALAAQGGENFKKMKSMWISGSVDLYAPNSSQSVPGKFAMVTAGDKVRLDVNAQPIVAFKQIYDGRQSYSSMPGVEMPPATKFGIPVLAKFDQPGYTVSALPDKKKMRGFRIVDAEGNTTDYYIDPATARVMQYLIPYNGLTFGTEHSKFKEIDGVLVPMNFTQRLEMAAGALSSTLGS